jgi:hypothetical protein
LSGIVCCLDDVCLFSVNGGRGGGADDDGFGVDGGVAVDLDTEHDLDDVAFLQNGDVLVRGQGREVRDGVVDRDRGGEGDTWRKISTSSQTLPLNVPLESPFLLFQTLATASETNLSPLPPHQHP